MYFARGDGLALKSDSGQRFLEQHSVTTYVRLAKQQEAKFLRRALHNVSTINFRQITLLDVKVYLKVYICCLDCYRRTVICVAFKYLYIR